MVEDIVLVLDKGDAEDMEDALWARQRLATQGVLREPFDQMIAHLGVDEVLLAPLQVDELLLGRQVEVQEPLDELGSLQSLQAGRVDQIALTQLQDERPVPLTPVLDAQDARGFDLVLVLLLVYVAVVLVLEVDLVVRYHLIVRQAHLSVDEELVAVHEQWREVT